MSKVTALVSTYNSEWLLAGCLDDLLAQSLYAQGRLEIVVVNAGSKQAEHRVIRDYLDKVVYIQSLREPLYASWNRAIALATGDYLTSANTDDRHAPNALETLADVLDARPDVALVYADAYVTETPNAVWGQPCVISRQPPYCGKLQWPDFDAKQLLVQCYGGPQPMWRRSLHDQYGGFDESFQIAGDFEFWLRLAARGEHFLHVQQFLGLFFDGGMGITNPELSAVESRRAVLRWRDAINGNR